MKLFTLATIVALLAITPNASNEHLALGTVKKRNSQDMLHTNETPAITLEEEMLSLAQPDEFE